MSVTPPTPAPAPIPILSLTLAERVVLSILLSTAVVLNVTTFNLGGEWSAYLSAAVLFGGYFGIAPVDGDAFQNLLMQIFPAAWVQWVHGILAAVIVAASFLAAHAGWSTALTAIVLGVIAALDALGFGPAGTEPVTTASVAGDNRAASAFGPPGWPGADIVAIFLLPLIAIANRVQAVVAFFKKL